MALDFARPVFAAAVCATLLASTASAVPAGFVQAADEILASSYASDAPGAAVIVVEGGKTVYARGRGLADLETRAPISPNTAFRMGSIAKQFTAALTMQLIEDGKLSLDDPVSKHLPDFPQPGASATIRQLLTHTSGIKNYTDLSPMQDEAFIMLPRTTAEMIGTFKDAAPPAAPGATWAYSNSGFILLGAIIEKYTGMEWHEAVAQRIARPLNLATIMYSETVPGPMATGYFGGDQDAEEAVKLHLSIAHAAGGLVGTVGDLAKWANALHHGKVVNAASYGAMTSRVKTSDGKTHPYGFGLQLSELKGHQAIGHNGGIPGFSADSIYLPHQDVFVAVFANTNQPKTAPAIVMRRLAAAAIGKPFSAFKEVAPDLSAMGPMLGVYALEDGKSERRFFERDGQLFTKRSGAEAGRVFAAGPNLFFYGPSSLNWFEIKPGPNGAAVMEMHHHGSDTAEVAVRTGPIPPEEPAFAVAADVLQSYVGDYRAGPVVATVALDPDGSLRMKITGQDFIPLRATSATEFAPRGIDARIVFAGDSKVLTLHQGGKSTPFNRIAAPR